MFWIIALLLAALAAFLLVLPLFRSEGASLPAHANDAEVYRDQLGEVERDAAAGLLDQTEAAQARAEIARRLIATGEKAEAAAATGSAGRASVVAMAVFLCLFLPLAGLLVYSSMGSPQEPDQPLAGRMASTTPDVNILIARTETHLSKNPDDGKAWELLAPIYMRQMRAEEAANAYRNAIRTLGPDAERLGSFGEALAVAAQGQVTKDSRAAFEQALTLAPKDPRARYYVALAEAQAGKLDSALALFGAIKTESPADAPWQGIVADQIASIEAMKKNGPATLGNPEQGDIDAAAAMSGEDRMQMIRTMVDSLDAKLADDPNNLEGWMRLIRSYGVLKEPQKALEALKRGLAAFPAQSDNGKALIALAKDIGIDTEGLTP